MDNSLHTYNENWRRKYIHPDMLLKDDQLILDEHKINGVGTDIFSFPIFTPLFCKELIEKADKLPEGIHKDGDTEILGWGTGRHNSYSTYDVELKSLGLDNVYKKVLK